MSVDWRAIGLSLLHGRRKSLGQTDRLGRPQDFTTAGGASWQIATFPHLHLPRMRKVPPRAIAETRDNEYLIECACGAHPVIERDLDEFQQCGGCQRYYLAWREDPWVFYGDMPVPGAPPEPSS